MPSSELLLLGLYFGVLACLSIYGLHRFYLVYLYTKYPTPLSSSRDSFSQSNDYSSDETLPFITVQLPIYNEMYVVERLIDAVCCLDYPRDRFEIQVLDDSTDETQQIARSAVDRAAAAGLAISYMPRKQRAGFKAGALAEGMRKANGEFLAIFDADFVPPPDFLNKVIPSFRDRRVGMVQARWGHLNSNYSLLTRVQVMLLDAHFSLEHGARYRGGLFFNFNGTAGVWRKVAITSAGGWQPDTLTEDLDLSYRAQLAGWRFVFLPELIAPAEVPVEMNAFKAQQYRWARGSVETGLKILKTVFLAQVSFRIKLEAFFHLTAQCNYPLLLVFSVLIVPALFVRDSVASSTLLFVDFPLFCAATLSMLSFYAVSQRAVRGNWTSQLFLIPAVMAVGIGLSVNNTLAVIGALTKRPAKFVRTPKYGVVQPGDQWLTKSYRSSSLAQPMVEVLLGFYFTAALIYAALAGFFVTLPFFFLFQSGFLYAGFQSLLQQRRWSSFFLRTQIAGD